MQTPAKMDACRGEFKIVPAGVVGFKTGELRGQIRIIRKAHPDNDKVFKFSGQLSAVCEQTPFAALHKIFFSRIRVTSWKGVAAAVAGGN